LGDDANSVSNESDVNGINGESLILTDGISALVSEEPRVDGIDADSWTNESQSGPGDLQSNEVGTEGKSEKPGESVNLGRKEVGNAKLPILVFFVGLWARAREGFQKAFFDFVNWWPFLRQEKRLALLIAEADANPQDAAKQSALFVELNKHRFGNALSHISLLLKIITLSSRFFSPPNTYLSIIMMLQDFVFYDLLLGFSDEEVKSNVAIVACGENEKDKMNNVEEIDFFFLFSFCLIEVELCYIKTK